MTSGGSESQTLILVIQRIQIKKGLEEKRMFDYKVFKSSNETVSKYVFTCPTAVAEAVLYQALLRNKV